MSDILIAPSQTVARHEVVRSLSRLVLEIEQAAAEDELSLVEVNVNAALLIYDVLGCLGLSTLAGTAVLGKEAYEYVRTCVGDVPA